jgi:Mrp family chromosome partitioning ATPase
MGKMLERLLKQAALAEGPPGPGAPAVPPLKAEPPPDEPPADAEVEFIEIGPRKSFEASPSVLACIEAARKAAAPPPVPQAPAAPVATAAPAVAPSVAPKVAFRAVPERPDAVRRPRFAPELVAFHDPGAGAHYRELLDSVLAARPGGSAGGSASLLFTATQPGIGATTALLNLAITAARQDRRVLVVDANLRRPAVAIRLGLGEAPGLREVLAGGVPPERALQQTEQPHLRALTAGALAGLPGPLPGVESVRALLRQLRQRFDLVLLDGPPWDGRADVNVLGGAADAVYLVVPAAEADAAPVTDLLRAIPEQGAVLAGCVLTTR